MLGHNQRIVEQTERSSYGVFPPNVNAASGVFPPNQSSVSSVFPAGQIGEERVFPAGQTVDSNVLPADQAGISLVLPPDSYPRRVAAEGHPTGVVDLPKRTSGDGRAATDTDRQAFGDRQLQTV